MKKFLPLILLGVGLLIVLIVSILVIKAKNSAPVDEEEASVPELPADQWPFVALIPTNNPSVPNSDGHWLDFKVQKIHVTGAASMDYELVYSTASGGQQGVPGTVKLDGNDIDRMLLLGSESSGKFRYDVGVETGTMTLRFRNDKGKLIGKLSTQFHLQSGVTELTSADGSFKYTLDKMPKGIFFVTMNTFASGYQVFSSDGKVYPTK
ncbi:MAG TPA: hypothetical protein VL401_04130 [Alphaproteobacteria bacterium]|jgi:hypothetical protein|nr:hypothetical protein [Alphaproteobacteria bacterium]